MLWWSWEKSRKLKLPFEG
uniref:BLTX69 n=1 Tax=Nephila pilipes TaxID=299642 RepID=A0A076KYW3_NEPPI|nr:BLTX69 [Nephila pilipes]